MILKIKFVIGVAKMVACSRLIPVIEICKSTFVASNPNQNFASTRCPPTYIRPLVVCDRGQETKQKITLAKCCPRLSLGKIRFQRFACTGQVHVTCKFSLLVIVTYANL